MMDYMGLILLGLLVPLNLTLTMYLIRRYFLLRRYEKAMVKRISSAMDQAKHETNTPASLKPEELDRYLTSIFSQVLTMVSAESISEMDPQGKQKLYGLSLVKFLEYVSPRAINAIEYRYGEDFVINWYERNYRMLYLNGVVDMVIQKTVAINEKSNKIGK